MLNFEKPMYKITDYIENNNYGKFELEPLERGFGTTIGNALRRVLLSSLQGGAVTAVKIDGVLHEFSVIEGVREDVTDVILNIKGLAVAVHSEGQKTMRFSTNSEYLSKCKPIYEEFDGNFGDISNCKTYDELPEKAKKYIQNRTL